METEFANQMGLLLGKLEQITPQLWASLVAHERITSGVGVAFSAALLFAVLAAAKKLYDWKPDDDSEGVVAKFFGALVLFIMCFVMMVCFITDLAGFFYPEAAVIRGLLK